MTKSHRNKFNNLLTNGKKKQWTEKKQKICFAKYRIEFRFHADRELIFYAVCYFSLPLCLCGERMKQSCVRVSEWECYRIGRYIYLLPLETMSKFFFYDDIHSNSLFFLLFFVISKQVWIWYSSFWSLQTILWCTTTLTHTHTQRQKNAFKPKIYHQTNGKWISFSMRYV